MYVCVYKHTLHIHVYTQTYQSRAMDWPRHSTLYSLDPTAYIYIHISMYAYVLYMIYYILFVCTYMCKCILTCVYMHTCVNIFTYVKFMYR